MQIRKLLPFISLTVILAACGGGSGGGTDNDARSSAVQQKNSSSEVSSTRSSTSSLSSQTSTSQESSSQSSSHSSASNGASSDPGIDVDGEHSSRASSSAAASSNYPLSSHSSSKATSSESSSNNGASSASGYSASRSSANSESSSNSVPRSSASSESSSNSEPRSSASSESSSNSEPRSSASSESSSNSEPRSSASSDSSSSANSESSNNSSSNFSASSESSNRSSSSIAADGKAPRATILFPSERSTIDKNEITIRGIAYDASGIDSVQVNGQPATLSGDNPGQAWQVTLPLSAGTNNIKVEVTDKSGETDASADQASVNWQQIPTTFDFDPATQTLYGFAPIDIVDFNLTSKQQRVYLEGHYLPISGCLHIGSSSYYYLVSANEDQFGLYRLEINNDTGAEETFEGYFSRSKAYFNSKLVCDSDGEALYLLVNQYHSGEGIDHSIIYRRSLAASSPWTPLYETDETSFVISDLVSGKDALIGYSEASEKIISISKSDGSSKTLFDNYTTFTTNVAHGSTKELVYLTNFDGIDQINIAEQTITAIGMVDSYNSLRFSQPRSTHFDPVNQRFLVGDSHYSSIISIDQNTGERSIALSNEMGTGPKMVAVRDIVLNESETYAYVIDDGGNASEKVIAIDLTTGNRRRIGEIYSEVNRSVAGLELDEANNALYVATSDTVYRIDLSTNATTTLALSDINQGAVFSSISSIAFDHENETLFISDAVQRQIVALNVNTLETSLVSSEFKGEGQVFLGINGLVFDPDTKFLYASNQGHGNVHKVDTETGNRTEIATACAPSSSGGEPADNIMELSFDSELNELLLVGFRVSRINLNTSTCSYDTYDHMLSSIEPLSGNRLLAGTSGALKLIDEETGEIVAISQ